MLSTYGNEVLPDSIVNLDEDALAAQDKEALLTSTDFEFVDRALWSCLNLLYSLEPAVDPSIRYIFDATRASNDLILKKFIVCGLMAYLPEMRDFYRERCPAHRFDRWLSLLEKEYNAFFCGLSHTFEPNCAKTTDARHPNINCLVTFLKTLYESG